jgi:hypothetical protein
MFGLEMGSPGNVLRPMWYAIPRVMEELQDPGALLDYCSTISSMALESHGSLLDLGEVKVIPILMQVYGAWRSEPKR